MLLGKTYSFWAACAFVLLLCYFTLYWQLGLDVMHEWDEARNAAHAINMAIDGNYLVRSFDGTPDLWETKPPLLVWLEVLCIKIFGFHIWAFRLPSALAATATAGLLFCFLYRHTQSIIAGVVAVAVLLSADGYLFLHCARTADHDALLILFETGMLISFYLFLNSHKKKANTYLAWCFICFTLGVYTKSIAIAMFLPGMLLYSLYQWRIVKLLKKGRFYLYAALSVFTIGLYYYLREKESPGYLAAVWDNELFPRFFNSSNIYQYEKITGPFIYLNTLATISFTYWIWAVAPALLAVFLIPGNKKIKMLCLFILLQALCFYVVITKGTFNLWYANPLLPLLSAIIGLGAYTLYFYVKPRLAARLKPAIIGLVATIIFAGVLYPPLYQRLKRVSGAYFYPAAAYGFLFNDVKKNTFRG